MKAKFERKGFKKSISYTTRPKREGEVEGVAYYFVSEQDFFKIRDHNKFIEWQPFETTINDKKVIVYYGTTREHFDDATLFIMTPAGLRDLPLEQRLKSMVIYLDIPEEIRRERLGMRIGGDDVETRIENDRNDFENFMDYDIRIENADF